MVDGGGKRDERSHPREQQPADWPFYRADRSRLYEESHNGNLLSFLTLPPPVPTAGLSPCGFSFLFHILCCSPLSLFLPSLLTAFCVFSFVIATSWTRPFDRTAIGETLRLEESEELTPIN